MNTHRPHRGNSPESEQVWLQRLKEFESSSFERMKVIALAVAQRPGTSGAVARLCLEGTAVRDIGFGVRPGELSFVIEGLASSEVLTLIHYFFPHSVSSSNTSDGHYVKAKVGRKEHLKIRVAGTAEESREAFLINQARYDVGRQELLLPEVLMEDIEDGLFDALPEVELEVAHALQALLLHGYTGLYAEQSLHEELEDICKEEGLGDLSTEVKNQACVEFLSRTPVLGLSMNVATQWGIRAALFPEFERIPEKQLMHGLRLVERLIRTHARGDIVLRDEQVLGLSLSLLFGLGGAKEIGRFRPHPKALQNMTALCERLGLANRVKNSAESAFKALPQLVTLLATEGAGDGEQQKSRGQQGRGKQSQNQGGAPRGRRGPGTIARGAVARGPGGPRGGAPASRPAGGRAAPMGPRRGMMPAGSAKARVAPGAQEAAAGPDHSDRILEIVAEAKSFSPAMAALLIDTLMGKRTTFPETKIAQTIMDAAEKQRLEREAQRANGRATQ